MLTIEGLSKRYPGGVQALKDVSLTIPPGLFGLLGPNGAGKSTLMRTLATLQDADAGAVWLGGDSTRVDSIEGREATVSGDAALPRLRGLARREVDKIDILKEPARVRAVLGYLPQEFGVYPQATAEQLLDYLAILKGLHRAGERKTEIERLLVKTNLWDVRKRPLGTYSGGMRQRFGIAQALIGAPKLVIVDEPTAGLDPEERMRFHTLLAQIGADVVVLLSTHIVHDVAELCGQMAILAGGQVRASGDPLELVAGLRGRVFRRFANPAALTLDPGVTLLSTRLAAGRPVVQVLAEAAPGEGWEPVEPTLEDVYFAELRRADARAAAPVDPPAGRATTAEPEGPRA